VRKAFQSFDLRRIGIFLGFAVVMFTILYFTKDMDNSQTAVLSATPTNTPTVTVTPTPTKVASDKSDADIVIPGGVVIVEPVTEDVKTLTDDSNATQDSGSVTGTDSDGQQDGVITGTDGDNQQDGQNGGVWGMRGSRITPVTIYSQDNVYVDVVGLEYIPSSEGYGTFDVLIKVRNQCDDDIHFSFEIKHVNGAIRQAGYMVSADVKGNETRDLRCTIYASVLAVYGVDTVSSVQYEVSVIRNGESVCLSGEVLTDSDRGRVQLTRNPIVNSAGNSDLHFTDIIYHTEYDVVCFGVYAKLFPGMERAFLKLRLVSVNGVKVGEGECVLLIRNSKVMEEETYWYYLTRERFLEICGDGSGPFECVFVMEAYDDIELTISANVDEVITVVFPKMINSAALK